MGRGHVVNRSHDIIGNVRGRAFANLILDIIFYQSEYAEDEPIEITINDIAESMYTQCDADGNEHLLLDSLFDYHEDKKVISCADQETSI